ncbi:MAG: type II toxin-antitoxin system HicB family antitoxin [Nitrospira sp.]
MEQVHLTLEYWRDDQWYVGQLRELPNVLSQGKTLEELKANIQDAYHLVVKKRDKRSRRAQARAISIPLSVPA